MSKLTKASNGSDCILCDRPDAYSCHYNGIRQHQYGKGRGVKGDDLMTAEFCYECDQKFSEGSTKGFADKIDRSEQFMHWINLTNIRRLKNGIIKL